LTVFSQIIREQKRKLDYSMKYKPLLELKKEAENVNSKESFKKSIIKRKNVSLIFEYKPASPSMGKISDINVEEAIKAFELGGASAISIITEETFFHSNLDNLKIASNKSALALLRKDFILDEYQIYEAKAYGASAVLLLANLYPDLVQGIEICQDLKLDAVVECKDKSEIKIALNAGAEIIGINNRSFSDFSIDFIRTKKLARFVPPEVVLISESGVRNDFDVKTLCNYRVDALLIGSSIMNDDSMSDKINELINMAKGARMMRNAN
jgi:indole-3-glycerol phosphate synthase